jgi:hypothetical protein
MARIQPSSAAKVKRASTPSRVLERGGRSKAAEIASNELTDLVLRACGVARDSVFNVRDFLANNSRMAFLAIRIAKGGPNRTAN